MKNYKLKILICHSVNFRILSLDRFGPFEKRTRLGDVSKLSMFNDVETARADMLSDV